MPMTAHARGRLSASATSYDRRAKALEHRSLPLHAVLSFALDGTNYSNSERDRTQCQYGNAHSPFRNAVQIAGWACLGRRSHCFGGETLVSTSSVVFSTRETERVTTLLHRGDFQDRENVAAQQASDVLLNTVDGE